MELSDILFILGGFQIGVGVCLVIYGVMFNKKEGSSYVKETQ